MKPKTTVQQGMGSCWLFSPLLHMTPNDSYLQNAYDAECPYLLNTYDTKLLEGQSIILEADNIVTNKCRANPKTSPDFPSDGKSGEVFAFARHLFATKFLRSWVMNQPNAFQHHMRPEGTVKPVYSDHK